MTIEETICQNITNQNILPNQFYAALPIFSVLKHGGAEPQQNLVLASSPLCCLWGESEVLSAAVFEDFQLISAYTHSYQFFLKKWLSTGHPDAHLTKSLGYSKSNEICHYSCYHFNLHPHYLKNCVKYLG